MTTREPSLIEWPAEEEIRAVSEQLARLKRAGIRLEANGDHFKSGDLAYQIREIIRTATELCKKCHGAKG